MTIKEVAQMIIWNSTDGCVNGQRFTEDELTGYIQNMFNGKLVLKNRLIMTINMPDGNWLFSVVKYGADEDCYDYIIPDTREEEEVLWEKLIGGQAIE